MIKSGPGYIERIAARVSGRASVIGARRAMARGDTHEMYHYLAGLAASHSGTHDPTTCDVEQWVRDSELGQLYLRKRP